MGTMPSWTNSLRQLRMDTTFSSLIMERVISACVQTSAQVFTMDRTMVKTTPTSCWSLVSAHCSPNPTYAVFTKQHTSMPLAMKVLIGGGDLQQPTHVGRRPGCHCRQGGQDQVVHPG